MANEVCCNPNVAEGREAFVQALRTRPQLFQKTAQRAWASFVIDPKEPAKIFKYNTLDLFRIADGKVVEHWDGTHKSVPGDFGAKSRGGGVYSSSKNLSAKEQETLKLGMVEFKDILQYGHTELAMQFMAPGYATDTTKMAVFYRFDMVRVDETT